MDQVASIAREVLLPSINVENERSCFDSRLKEEWPRKVRHAVLNLKTLISDYCLNPGKEEWTSNSSQDLLDVLILCGEHSTCADWSTQEVVHNVNDLLELVISKFGVERIQDLFALNNMSYFILQKLKPKLGKKDIKSYPAAVNCFVWVLTNTMLPSIDEILPLAVPVSLVIFDDWEPDYQRKGLDCIFHILIQNPTSLQQCGWPAVFFNTLKKNIGFHDKLKLYKCLDACLKVQHIDPGSASCWNSEDQYDLLVTELLQSMIINNSPSSAKTDLEILSLLFDSVKIKMMQFLPSVINVLDNYIIVGVSPDVHQWSVKVVEQVIHYCWPCLQPQFTNQLSWILFKLASENLESESLRSAILNCKEMLEKLSLESAFSWTVPTK